ncbi:MULTISPECIES: hypothetical protein [unclassified Aminobacter]|uniref:hypothetical protein n=1 Tax=unclassified Aminobacter TaxID=2644704 RepID=UPI00046471D5|nr:MULTISPECIES: hypothetical protein [unclassified Aminobacter]TWH35591.1 tail tube protein [Aminobacter sp. J15]
MAITQMTALEAVNLILKNMGEAPVNSLSGALPLEASQAYDTLQEISKAVQTEGWYFNTEYRNLTPDHTKTIYLPSNVLSVKTVGASKPVKVTARGNRLFNITPFANTYAFEGPVSVQMILGLEFEELPASARTYIALRAARVSQVRDVGDEMNLNEDTSDENRALAMLHAEQLAAEPLTLREAEIVNDVTSRLPMNSLRLI